MAVVVTVVAGIPSGGGRERGQLILVLHTVIITSTSK